MIAFILYKKSSKGSPSHYEPDYDQISDNKDYENAHQQLVSKTNAQPLIKKDYGKYESRAVDTTFVDDPDQSSI